MMEEEKIKAMAVVLFENTADSDDAWDVDPLEPGQWYYGVAEKMYDAYFNPTRPLQRYKNEYGPR